MGKQYSIADAKNQLSGIVHDVEAGEPVKLTRRGKPVAVLMSEAEYERLTAKGKPDLWEAIQAFRLEHDLGALDFTDADFEGLRDNSPAREFQWEN